MRHKIMKHPVMSLENKKVGDIELADFFSADVRLDLITRAVHWQRNKARQGTHKVKTIAEISGTGKKPFKQKGTGSARAGSTRATHHRGGQTVFGPVVRSHETDLPKKVRAAALRSALASKAKEGKLIILDAAKLDNHKTKTATGKLTAMNLSNALIVFNGELDSNFKRAVSNIPYIDVLPQKGANVLDILKHDTLVLTQDAVTALQERLA
jgi:large subunit ribosomal protein L4